MFICMFFGFHTKASEVSKKKAEKTEAMGHQCAMVCNGFWGMVLEVFISELFFLKWLASCSRKQHLLLLFKSRMYLYI